MHCFIIQLTHFTVQTKGNYIKYFSLHQVYVNEIVKLDFRHLGDPHRHVSDSTYFNNLDIELHTFKEPRKDVAHIILQ